MKNIDRLLCQIDAFINSNIVEYPQLKAMNMLKDLMRDNHVPTKHIGRIKFDIDHSFFENEEKAEIALKGFALGLKKTYEALQKEYGEDADIVFNDLLFGMSITCKD